MIKESVTYTDFNGVEKTTDVYFNISDTELADLMLTTEGNLEEKLDTLIKGKDTPGMAAVFKSIMLQGYGEKSDDGNLFIKKKNGVKLSEAFEQSAAFDALYMDLFSHADKMAAFIKGMLSKKMQAEIETAENNKKAQITTE